MRTRATFITLINQSIGFGLRLVLAPSGPAAPAHGPRPPGRAAPVLISRALVRLRPIAICPDGLVIADWIDRRAPRQLWSQIGVVAPTTR